MVEVLLIEDDNTLGMTLDMTLRSNGHRVQWCTTLADSQRCLSESSPNLIILDLGLPDGDGLEICRALRESESIAPILILSARSTLHDRVAGLTAGADDYLTKPFELPELLARVDALLRRMDWHGREESGKEQIGQLEVNFGTREASVRGEAVPLTELEFKLLRYLLDHSTKVVPREELLDKVWGLPGSTKTRTVDVFISRLRRHIEIDSSHPHHLLLVRGVGYRLVKSDHPALSEHNE